MSSPLKTTGLKTTGFLMATAAVALLAGCGSAPTENPQLSRLESEIKVAYGDKYAAEYGHADLASAETALTAVRTSMRDGNAAETQHDLIMAEGYIDLAKIHGLQEQTKAETTAFQARQAELTAGAQGREALQALKTADDAKASQAALQKTADMQEQLRIYNLKITELGATLVLHDVMFATGSANLRSGAANRLTPLINYLRSSPTTSVRIEGHTDNTGTTAHNDELSLDRANSVAQALTAGGQIANPIQTLGSGQTKPVASNDTVSGREQNRRVEITLLQ